MEGWGIAIVVALVLGYAIYEVAEPVIYRMWPEYRATKEGPRGFPITLHIGADALRVTNRSREQWVCTIGLGSRAPHRATAAIEAGATVDIPFDKFRTQDESSSGDRTERVNAARRMLSADCVEPGGTRQHSFSWSG